MIKQFGTEEELWVFVRRLNGEFGGYQEVPWINGCGRYASDYILPKNWEEKASQLTQTWVEMYRKNADTTIQDAVDICEGM